MFQYCPQRGGDSWQLQLGLSPGLGASVPTPRSRLPRDLRSEGRGWRRWRRTGQCGHTGPSHHHVPTPQTRPRSPWQSGQVPHLTRHALTVRHVAQLLPRPLTPGHQVTFHLAPGSDQSQTGGPGSDCVLSLRSPRLRADPGHRDEDLGSQHQESQ